MGHTIAEKILADHAGKKEVYPGDMIMAKVDLVLANDITAPLSIRILEEYGINKVFSKEKIALVMDHFTPAKDIKSATQVKYVREFARKFGIKHYYEGGNVGIEHALLPEKGLVRPGMLVVGADSHTCTYGALGAFSTGMGSTDIAFAMATGEVWLKVPETIKFIYRGKLKKWTTAKDIILYTIGKIGVDGALYKVMEFDGEIIRNLSVSERLTISNMAIEAGGKAGIIQPDEKTIAYVKERTDEPFKLYYSDPDAHYEKIYEWDLSDLDPVVAHPYSPDNVKSVWESTSITIDQVFIGSCTNGKYEDLKIAAEILKGRKVHPYVRCIVIPATPQIYEKALKTGLLEIFLQAGCVIGPCTCGPCLGGHMGVLAEGERCVSTSNRNFPGRMGHVKSEVYLASPAVAAASAVLGRIAHPEEVVGKA